MNVPDPNPKYVAGYLLYDAPQAAYDIGGARVFWNTYYVAVFPINNGEGTILC